MRAIGRIRTLSRLAARGTVDSATVDATLTRLSAIDMLDDVVKADFVIDAATEREEIKLGIFDAIGKHLHRKRSWRPTRVPYPSRA